MSKNALICSPFFFGSLFLVLIAFTSEGVRGVRGQYPCPGTGISFGAKTIYGSACYSECGGYCASLALPIGMPGPKLGVKSGTCYQIYSGPGTNPPMLCWCCVA
ncbi:hypothetical protein MKW94_011591 [Papaver nudicaule]|uniref:Uncharacterized protein n=1 Tax=Papaver nudicaule TaxID=74823 RepID=A0AA41SDW7_PAPNU|nr:hypothetical protein [Papaver nudicaule]